jgi:hypothetical protein
MRHDAVDGATSVIGELRSLDAAGAFQINHQGRHWLTGRDLLCLAAACENDLAVDRLCNAVVFLAETIGECHVGLALLVGIRIRQRRHIGIEHWRIAIPIGDGRDNASKRLFVPRLPIFVAKLACQIGRRRAYLDLTTSADHVPIELVDHILSLIDEEPADPTDPHPKRSANLRQLNDRSVRLAAIVELYQNARALPFNVIVDVERNQALRQRDRHVDARIREAAAADT